jgi:hypothetical protein
MPSSSISAAVNSWAAASSVAWMTLALSMIGLEPSSGDPRPERSRRISPRTSIAMRLRHPRIFLAHARSVFSEMSTARAISLGVTSINQPANGNSCEQLGRPLYARQLRAGGGPSLGRFLAVVSGRAVGRRMNEKPRSGLGLGSTREMPPTRIELVHAV